MASKPLFSIVTVTLNCREDALATAKSVASQNFQDYEYIIKDGGSTDGTVQRLRKQGFSVHEEKDNGIYHAMNQALELCHGKYVLFLNAGDIFFESDVLQQLVAHIRSTGKADIYYGDVVMNIPHPNAHPQEHRRLRRRMRYPAHVNRFFLYRRGLCHQAWIVRREVYRKDPFDLQLKIMADYDFLLNQALRKKTRMAHIPLVMVDYKGMGSSEQLRDEWLKDRRRVVRKYFPPCESLIYEAVRLSAKFLLNAAYKAGLFLIDLESS